MKKSSKLQIDLESKILYIRPIGIWDKDTVSEYENKDNILEQNFETVIFDFLNTSQIDTVGIIFFLDFESKIKKYGRNVKKINMNVKISSLFELCKKSYPHEIVEKRSEKQFSNFFYKLGKYTLNYLFVLKEFFLFSGYILNSFLKALKYPKDIRFKATLYHIEYNALKALPVIMLTSLLVGIVLAYQASVQLEQFGANIFIVDMVGISALRELSPLITAIVIAGRSASSFTAQIGVMKLTDEIDAMRSMGFSFWNFIVLPRVIALVIGVPLVIIVADACTIFGGMIIADISLNISFAEFMNRFQIAVELKHFYIGLIKAPFFGYIIGSIGCFMGFTVKKTTESIGIYTTKSVVDAIFWVIVFNAFFSVFLTEMKI